MAEDKKTDDSKTDDKLTAGGLRDMIKEMVTDAVAALTPKKDTDTASSKPSDAPTDVAGQVQAELARLKRREERDARDKKIDDQLAELQGKTADKPPMERRKVHGFMGWGENE